jgi:uncharacterized protein YheU (UPF0270 family)
MPENEQAAVVVIPESELSRDALAGVLKSFVLREGTEYGERDVPLETKLAQVKRQLERGEAHIVFDPESQSIDIVTNKQLSKLTEYISK